jgi:hypothetical protein
MSITMQFGGAFYQLFVACCIGLWLGLRREDAQVRAAALGAQFSFFLGAAIMLFSEAEWWPVTVSIIELASWAITGPIAAFISYKSSAYAKLFVRKIAGQKAVGVERLLRGG